MNRVSAFSLVVLSLLIAAPAAPGEDKCSTCVDGPEMFRHRVVEVPAPDIVAEDISEFPEPSIDGTSDAAFKSSHNLLLKSLSPEDQLRFVLAEVIYLAALSCAEHTEPLESEYLTKVLGGKISLKACRHALNGKSFSDIMRLAYPPDGKDPVITPSESSNHSPERAFAQPVDIGASGVSGFHKALKVPLNGVVRVGLPSGQAALIQITAIGAVSAEYRWKYRAAPGGEVIFGHGRVEEKYERQPTAEPHRFTVKLLPGHDVTIRAGEILAEWSSGGDQYCYFYYDSKLAKAKVLEAQAFEKRP